MMKKMGGGHMTKGLHHGLTKKSPSAEDASTKAGKGSVNKEATRSGTAPTPKTLGPRNA